MNLVAFVNSFEKIVASTGNRVLVAPLNWGLGHVTRCIPIIKALEKQQKTVFLASDGAALQLLRAEFPNLMTFELPSYQIRYPSPNMVFHILLQLPRIMKAMYCEHQETKSLSKKYGFDTIISDNRYGCYVSGIHSILITHQLNIPFNQRLVQRTVKYLIRKLIQPFQELWIPDRVGADNLSGLLSHPIDFVHPPVKHLGVLSRMNPISLPIRYEVAIILSGPEPQRSILEQKLLEQALTLNKRVVLVQGKTNVFNKFNVSEKVEVVSFLTSTDLNELMATSEVIVCRSGYSSIMDLIVMGKKALLVPTPGQPEQEYLAKHVLDLGLFVCQDQNRVDLSVALETLGNG